MKHIKAAFKNTIILWTVGGITIMTIAYIALLLFAPFKEDTIAVTVQSPVHAGVSLHYQASICGYKKVPVTVAVRFIEPHQSLTGPSVSLASFPSFKNIKGCTKFVDKGNLIVPMQSKPGIYQIRIDITYKVNPFRTVVQTVYTNTFQVTN